MTRFLMVMAVLAAFPPRPAEAAEPASHQATGVKVGEVTTDSAIVWMRLTAKAERVAADAPADGPVDALPGACPGAPGRVRLRYDAKEDLAGAAETEWATVAAETDFTHQFRLTGLKPATVYHYAAESSSLDGATKHGALRGRFETAPPPNEPAAVSFTVITGQRMNTCDDAAGQRIYEGMLALKPKFIVPTGDSVYYDLDPPLAASVELARHHWHRVYSQPRLVAFHLQVPGYWEKDDHDTLCDDCWPAMKGDRMAPLTFKDGQKIFREQVPLGDKTYRSVRWGRGLEIWLVEGRDFRSANSDPDGPDKTIWGAEQKAWVKQSILASDAEWKVLVSPTPLIGPDRSNKRDNHCNAAFATEGREMREWLHTNATDNLFVACGDRHWQYHSVDPRTGLHEFCSGPTTDRHAGGTPGLKEDFHHYHRVCGGFLSVSVSPQAGGSRIAFAHHDVAAKTLYEFTVSRGPGGYRSAVTVTPPPQEPRRKAKQGE